MTDSETHNDTMWVDVDTFFAEGPLKVRECNAKLPVEDTFSHVGSADASTTLPCVEVLKHVDESSYPTPATKEHTPAFKRYTCQVENTQTGHTDTREVFLKFSGVLDPNELVRNKYEEGGKHDRRKDKMARPNNTAYVESLASYLTSKLTEEGVCPHFPKVYGVYSGTAEKHFVEFTEEYNDHRRDRTFQDGVKDNKWKMVPEMSDSETEEELSDEEDFSFDKLAQDINQLSTTPSQEGLQNMMQMLMKSYQNDDNADTLESLTSEMANVFPPTPKGNDTSTPHGRSESDAADENQKKDEANGVDTNTDTQDNADATESDVDSEDARSDLSYGTNEDFRELDINTCQELRRDDIEVVNCNYTKADGSSNSNTASTTHGTCPHASHNLLNDTEFCETLTVHEEPLKVRKDIERFGEYNEHQRFLQMSNVPVQVVAMEAYDTTLESVFKQDMKQVQHYETLYTRERFLSKDVEQVARKCAYRWLFVVRWRKFEKKWTALLCQVCMALVAMQHQYDMVHNDMHGLNILLAPTTQKVLRYQVNGTHYEVPTFGYIVKLIDWGRTTFQMDKTMYMSDVFADRGEAGEQYSYIHHYDGAVTDPDARSHLLLPNACFDLTRLACSLLDEFFDSAGAHCYDGEYDEQFPLAEDTSELYHQYNERLFCRPTTSRFYNMLCEWITDCGKEPVNRFENFDLYKQIARRMRQTVPVDQLKRPHFATYEVEEDANHTYYNLTRYCAYSHKVDQSMNRPVYDSDNERYKQSSHFTDDESEEEEWDELDNVNDITSAIQSMCTNLNA